MGQNIHLVCLQIAGLVPVKHKTDINQMMIQQRANRGLIQLKSIVCILLLCKYEDSTLNILFFGLLKPVLKKQQDLFFFFW